MQEQEPGLTAPNGGNSAQDAPQDPVLNHYFLAAYTAREATLQQLGGSLPVDRTIETY